MLILLTLFNDILKISLALEAFFTLLFCCFSQAHAMSPSFPEITALQRSDSSIPKCCVLLKDTPKRIQNGMYKTVFWNIEKLTGLSVPQYDYLSQKQCYLFLFPV